MMWRLVALLERHQLKFFLGAALVVALLTLWGL